VQENPLGALRGEVLVVQLHSLPWKSQDHSVFQSEFDIKAVNKLACFLGCSLVVLAIYDFGRTINVAGVIDEINSIEWHDGKGEVARCFYRGVYTRPTRSARIVLS
jgi:hypothetical protein